MFDRFILFCKLSPILFHEFFISNLALERHFSILTCDIHFMFHAQRLQYDPCDGI